MRIITAIEATGRAGEEDQEYLILLHGAEKVEDLNYPGAGLHPLKGDLKGYWSVTVTGNYRIIFRFENGNAHLVDYLDYH